MAQKLHGNWKSEKRSVFGYWYEWNIEPGAFSALPPTNYRFYLHLTQNMLIEAQRIENSEIKLQTCLHCPYSINGTVYVLSPYSHLHLLCTNHCFSPEICDHMFEEHGFSVGLPDNLVHLPRLLNILRIKLEHMQCFYCEYIFRTTKLLKEHMRKKKHWRIPQSRPLYDRFYLVTYSNVDMEPYNVEDPEDENEDTAEDEEYQGWDEDERDGPKDMAQCIYCPSSFESPRLCFQHLSSEHKFDFFRFKTSLGLTPYQCIALLNYARKCSKELKCMTCDVNHATSESLLAHMRDENHFHPPIDSPVFTDPSYVCSDFIYALLDKLIAFNSLTSYVMGGKNKFYDSNFRRRFTAHWRR